MKGWFKLHRQVTESAVFHNADLLRLWIWILSRTNFSSTHVPMKTGRGETIVTLQPGESVIGRHVGAKSLGWKPSTFDDRIKKLERLGMITRNPDTHWTVISVVNWGKFQQPEDGDPTGKQHPSNTQATHCKKG